MLTRRNLHADKLTQLGPRPIIASLSLGATRTFRLRYVADGSKQQSKASINAASEDGQTPRDSSNDSSREVKQVDITLPHNTLVIMWPPTQEEWRHEVSPSRCRAVRMNQVNDKHVCMLLPGARLRLSITESHMKALGVHCYIGHGRVQSLLSGIVAGRHHLVESHVLPAKPHLVLFSAPHSLLSKPVKLVPN